MKVHRRHVLAGLAGAAVPGGTVAQTASKVYRVGLLTPTAPLADTSPFGAPLVRGLAQHGYSQGRNLIFERRGAEGHLDRLPQLVAELVARHRQLDWLWSRQGRRRPVTRRLMPERPRR